MPGVGSGFSGLSAFLHACQSLAHLEFQHQTVGDPKFDPVRISPAISAELLTIWDNLDAEGLPRPRSLAILHPTIRRAGAFGTTAANLIVDPPSST